ncbi:hypothetical protein HJFPF1_02808 [Paramyrothecium foliicola]|nr:hypothetical protein HJFPF1_02808 [Paramyrothecium foliicola]
MPAQVPSSVGVPEWAVRTNGEAHSGLMPGNERRSFDRKEDDTLQQSSEQVIPNTGSAIVAAEEATRVVTGIGITRLNP